MTRTAFPIALAAAALLSLPACESKTITADETVDPQAEELAKAAPVTLPPSIKESKTYRCKDNSVVYVNVLSDGKSINIRSLEDAPPTATLTMADPGGSYTDGKFSLSGVGDTVTFASPGVPGQTCKA